VYDGPPSPSESRKCSGFDGLGGPSYKLFPNDSRALREMLACLVKFRLPCLARCGFISRIETAGLLRIANRVQHAQQLACAVVFKLPLADFASVPRSPGLP